ncbi:MAG: sigma-70 family RNA polymerase sigma factor [Bacteroidota bacterium]
MEKSQETAFWQQIEQHQGILFKLSRVYRDRPEDREDLRQEMLYQLWRSFPSWSGQAKFSTWMYRVALSTALADFRKGGFQLRKQSVGLEKAAVLHSENLEEDEQLSWLYRAISRLEPLEKAIISLYLEDYAYAEIAAMLELTENHVGVKMHRIRQRLKKDLQHMRDGY